MYFKRGMRFGLVAMLFVAMLACRTADVFIAQATITPTRTLRPTLTPIPKATDTPIPVPTQTVPPVPTSTPTRRPPTARPPTPKPQPTAASQPTVSAFEFHTNPPSCTHAGQTYLKGTVYLDKNDPNNKYVGAIVALGPPDASTVYVIVRTGDDGTYTFNLGDAGQAKPGNWGIWLVDPSQKRKSDIGGPITTNDLPDSNPNSCWAGIVDFWK